MKLLRGRTVTGLSLTVLFLAMTGGDALAQQGGPGPAPPPASRVPAPMLTAAAWTWFNVPEWRTTGYVTPVSTFAKTDPFINPSNLLPNVYANIKSLDGSSIPNTLPSTPGNPYNLHDGEPTVTPLSPTESLSPADDLRAIYEGWYTNNQVAGSYQPGNPYSKDNYHYHQEYFNTDANKAAIQRGINALEGNTMTDRKYSGMPMLHIAGGDQVATVIPRIQNGQVVGGDVTVHQVWFGQHIEESTSFIDTHLMTTVEARNVPWTITYVVSVLNRGNDDFSPLELFNSDPDVKIGPTAAGALPQVMMDGTFFPMFDRTEVTFKIKMPPAKFFQLIYTWGWRNHPGRIAVMENSGKSADPGNGKQWQADLERNVFRQKVCAPGFSTITADMYDPQGNPTYTIPGPKPGDPPVSAPPPCKYGLPIMTNAATKAYAISFIGDLAPAKRMWTALKTLQSSGYNPTVMAQYERAYHQWQNRLQLPDGLVADKYADMTLAYLNNSIYGQLKGMDRLANKPILEKWHMRGTLLYVKLLNGDYFPHGYGAVNFGGLRGWENLYQSAHKIKGDGDTFTFGRVQWGLDTINGTTVVPAAIPSLSAAIKPTAAALKVMTDTRTMTTNRNDPILAGTRLAIRNAPSVRYLSAQTFNFPDIAAAGTGDAATREAGLQNVFGNLGGMIGGATSGTAQKGGWSPPVIIAGNGDTLGDWNIGFQMNYEPSLRLRTYQFDPLHHIQAIWAIH